MKKSMILLGMLSIGYAYAQEGNVGINTENPKATLDITPEASNLAGTTNEGIIAPRLTKTRIANIEASKLTEGTLVYSTDAVYTAGADTAKNNRVAKINEKGYYFYNGTEWVKVQYKDTNDAEWVYDDATKRINLKRSGQTTSFVNEVYYDAQTGQYTNVDDENNIKNVNLKLTGTVMGFEEFPVNLSTDIKYRQYLYAESKNLQNSTTKNTRGINSTYKQLGETNLLISEDETSQTLGMVNSNVIVPTSNSKNYTSISGNAFNNKLFGTGTVAISMGQSTTLTLGNTQKITNFATGILGGVAVNTSGTVGQVLGIYGRNLFYSPQGATVERAASGYFENYMPFQDKSLIKENTGIYNRVINNSENTGDGTLMAGIYNEVSQTGKTKYPNIYGIFTRTSVRGSGGTIQPDNIYGVYIDNVGEGTVSNYAIYSNAGKVRVGDLANASATTDRTVVVDKDGVLKVANTEAAPTTISGKADIPCDETNRGKMNLIQDHTSNGKTFDVFGICLKGTNGYSWRYIYGNAGVSNGSGNFGSGLQ